ncbi:MAG: HYR domain-containing protein, partial [Bacteroidota bacterium]
MGQSSIAQRFRFCFVLLLGWGLFGAHFGYAQCPNNNLFTPTPPTAFDASALTIGVPVQHPTIWGGEYMHLDNIVAGDQFTITTCGTVYNSALTIYSGESAIPLFFSDDVCGDDAQISFTATVPGTYRLLVDQMPGCASNATNSIINVTKTASGASSCSAGSIVTQPSNQSTCPNGMATFTADTATGGAADSVRWQVSTNGGGTWTALSDGSPYSGTATQSLNINPAGAALNGRLYRMVAFYCATVETDESSSAQLTVGDNINPSLTCPSNQQGFVDASCNISLPDFTGSATVSDNCDPSPAVTQSPVTGTTVSGAGTNLTVQLIATDASFNSNTCTFTFTTVDNIAPTIMCPPNQTGAVDASCNASLPDFTGSATVNDNCDASPTVTQSPAPSTTVTGSGTNITVSLLATDASFNSSTCTFTFTTEDNTAPSITCPGAQSLIMDATCMATLPDYTTLAAAADNCDPTPTITQSPAIGATVSGVGPTVVTLTATDDDGNSNSCMFNVNHIDSQDPTIVCPPNQTGPVDASCNVSLPDFTGSATTSDNCDPSPTVTQSPVPSTTVSGAGTSITISLLATDASFNSNTCTFTFTTEDTTAPAITCPGAQSINMGAGCTATLPDFSGVTVANDNCDPTPTITQSPTSGSTVSGVGPTVVTMTATDDDGNSNSCTFNVAHIDTEDPVIVCPPNQTGPVDASCNVSLPDFTGSATTSDNCDPSPTVTQSPAPSTTVSGAGTSISVSLLATDASLNSATCTFTFTTQDTTDPNITCPSTQSVIMDAACNAMLADYTGLAAATDNCDPTPTITQSPASGATVSGAGPTSVMLTATDDDGNSASCTFNVSHIDNTNPTIVCPPNQTGP